MANCTNCSAPLPTNTIQCEYCGSRNDIDLTGINYNTTHELESPRTCPRCELSLKTIDLGLGGTFLIERCDSCLGLFFDPGELEALLEGTVSNVFEINQRQIEGINNARRSTEYGVSYIRCPECSQFMNRINYGARSGVIVDRCKDHGVWLDGGELRHLMEWMKAGGKLLDQERKEQQKKDAAAELVRKEHAAATTSPLQVSCEDTHDSMFPSQDHLLFDAICSGIRYFLRE